jgi:hypothetical protein
MFAVLEWPKNDFFILFYFIFIRMSLDFGLRVASWHVYFISCSLSHYAGNRLLFSMILHED